jgi:hypothetical protein
MLKISRDLICKLCLTLKNHCFSIQKKTLHPTPCSRHGVAGVHLLGMARSSATPKALLLWVEEITAGVPRGLCFAQIGVSLIALPYDVYTNR